MDAIRHYHDLRELSGREQQLRAAAEQHRRLEERRAADPAADLGADLAPGLRRRSTVGRGFFAVLARVARAVSPSRRSSA